MSKHAIPKKYRCDHLFITVGTNPLPNYVSAMLLSHDSSTIYLLHSDGASGAPSTKPFAENLRKALVKKGFSRRQIVLSGISEADGEQIEEQMIDLLEEEELEGKVGLDNTGGTKPMSVHTYRVLEEIYGDGTFSYLDARQLAMRIKGVSKPYPVVHSVSLTLDELAALHGYKRLIEDDNWAKPENTPGLLELCDAIAQVHTTYDGIEKWKSWANNLSHNRLPTEFTGVSDALKKLCDGSATPNKVAKKLKPNKTAPRLTSCQMWFQGLWLEEHTLACVDKIAGKFQIKSKEKNLKYILPNNEDFELDVAAMLGHQLFAISCKRGAKKPELKLGLFEAYVRARQLGGDEARVALVCCHENGNILEEEIKREWHVEGKIRVFDRNDLKNLSGAFTKWFKMENK